MLDRPSRPSLFVRLLSSVAVASLCGCPSPAQPGPVVIPQAAEPTPAAEPAVELEPGLRVEITPMLAPAPQVRVAIELRGPATSDETLREWSLPGPLATPLEPTVRDANGELPLAIAADGAGLRVTLERAPSLPLRIEYTLQPVPAIAGTLARVELDELHFFATGEALLLLPDQALDRRGSLSIHIAADAFAPEDPDTPTGMPPLRAASSFAAEDEVELEGWPFELRRAAFVAGPLEWARFDSLSGDDRWLGVGPTRFDHRWSAAEVASIRSIVDARIGMPTLDPWLTILLSSSRSASEPAFAAELRGRGLVILADPNAVWDVSARISAAQMLAARWLGGRVRVTEATKPELAQQRALWFDAGVTRFVARELLYEVGLLSDDEYAAELDLIELELASSPLRERTLDELAALAAAGAEADPAARLAAADARALLVARGAMYMAWLEHELRNSKRQWSNDGVIEVLRLLVARAVAEERRELELAELVHQAALKYSRTEPPDAAFMARFEEVVVQGRRPALADEAFGPCFRPRKRKLRRFELGFVDATRPDDERPSFTALDPVGPAAKAGLRADDSLVSLDYVFGDSEQPVTLGVARGDRVETIEYQPAGPAQRVIQWQRVAGVPPEACVR